MDPLHALGESIELRPDGGGPDDRIEMAGAEHFRRERLYGVDRVEEREREAEPIGAQCDEVGEVAEQCGEHVADEGNPSGGQPHNHRVDRLAARSRDALDARRTEVDLVAILEEHVGSGRGLGGDRRVGWLGLDERVGLGDGI